MKFSKSLRGARDAGLDGSGVNERAVKDCMRELWRDRGGFSREDESRLSWMTGGQF